MFTKQNRLGLLVAYYDWWRFKELPTKTTFDKKLRAKEFNIVTNSKHDEHQCGIVSDILIKSLLVMLLHMPIMLPLKLKL